MSQELLLLSETSDPRGFPNLIALFSLVSVMEDVLEEDFTPGF